MLCLLDLIGFENDGGILVGAACMREAEAEQAKPERNADLHERNTLITAAVIFFKLRTVTLSQEPILRDSRGMGKFGNLPRKIVRVTPFRSGRRGLGAGHFRVDLDDFLGDLICFLIRHLTHRGVDGRFISYRRKTIKYC